MFNTMQVARTIREARISRNMTQMNLADAMEVSYQAVSNWERGNSMPDIAKLEQLCQVLDIKLENLLGGDSSRAVTKVMEATSPAIRKTVYRDSVEQPVPDGGSADDGTSEGDPISVEDICNVAPLLPPNDIEALVENNVQQAEEKIDLSAITALAPFLDSEYLERLVRGARVHSLSEVVCIAPFLSTSVVDSLVLNSNPKCDMDGIVALAPFLSGEALNTLALDKLYTTGGSLQKLTALAPFLSSETLDVLIERSDPECDMNGIIALAPFLSSETLNKLALNKLYTGIGSLQKLTALAPFLSSETLDVLIERSDPECDMNGIVSLAPFLSSETLNSLALNKLHAGSLTQLAGLAPFLSSETLDALIERSDPECDMNGIVCLAPFLSSETLNRLAAKLMANGVSGSKMSCLFPFLSQGALQQIAESMMK